MNVLRPAKHSKDPDVSMIKELSALLREQGVKVLSGDTKFALTTTTLNCLNKCFERLKDEEAVDEIIELSSSKSSKVEYSFHANIQYIFDFIKRLYILKVTQGTSTLQGSVDVSQFINLKILELKRIPIHLFVGLKSLRNRLQMIVCERCLQTLEDLFAMCGGDRSSPFAWPELLSADLSFNSIESLDTSLRLVSSLVSLNISHNCLENTEGLQCLNELEYLNLSYNKLQRLPQLSLRARARLKVLSLRNNALESLDGLEGLSNLLQVDLAYNCLIDHCSLSPFRQLQFVRYILLEGNPISFHEHHRILTIQHLHHKAQTVECLLDGKAFPRVEIMDAKKLAIGCCSFKYNSYVLNDGASINSASGHLVHSANDMCLGDNDPSSDEGAISNNHLSSDEKSNPSRAKASQTKKERVRKFPIVRDAQIDEDSLIESNFTVSDCIKAFDTSHTDDPLSPYPMEISGDHLQTKEEIEKCRQKHGKEWLIISTKLCVLPLATEPPNTEDVGNESSLSFSRENEVTLDHRSGRVNRSSQVSDDVIILNEECEQQPLLPPQLPQIAVSSHLNDFGASETHLLSMHSNHAPDEFQWEKMPHAALSNDEDDDENACSSPFIMQIEQPESGDTVTVLVVVSERDIREKDFITGHTIERLELRSIRSLDLLTPKSSIIDGTMHKFPRIRLTFNYVRKDRKERIYIIEDNENCEQFLALIKPVFDALTFEEMTLGALQCLKCSSHFSKEVAKRVVRKSQRPSDGFIALSSSADALKEHLSEEIACPNCGSEMLIEIDPSAMPNYLTNSDTISPFTRFKCSDPTTAEKSLLGAPVNQSTPLSFSSFEPRKTKSLSSALGSSCPANYTDGPLSEKTAQEDHLRLKSDANQERSKSYATPKLSRPTDRLQSDVRFGMISLQANVSPSSVKRCNVLQVEVEVHTPQKTDSEMEQGPRLCSSLTLAHTQSAVDGSGLKRTESDITILSNPSQSSIMVMPNPSAELTLDAISENSLDCNRKMATFVQDSSSLNASDKKYLIPKHPSKLDSCSSGSFTSSAFTTMDKSVYDSNLGETPDSFISALSGGDDVRSYHFNSISCDRAKDLTDKQDETNVEATISEDSTELISDSDSDSNCIKTDFAPNFSEMDHGVIHKSSLVHIKKPFIWSCQNGDMNYSFQDFGQIDHRLKLYVDLEILNASEEFVAVLRSGVVPYMKGEEWPGLLVISKTKIYIMKIIGPENDQPQLWLQKFAVHQLHLLYFVNVRLGSQAFQLEFGPKSAPVCYSFILRDADNCNNFVCFLMEKLKAGLLDLPETQLQFGLNDYETLQTIREQLLTCVSDDELSKEMDESTILLYVMGYWTPSGGKGFEPISLVTTSSDILIFTEDFHWPLPHLIMPSNDVLAKSQLTLLTSWKIQDLAAVEHTLNHPFEIYLKFFDEDAQEESLWNIALETERSLQTFLQALSTSWEKLFGVDLQITNSHQC